MTCTAAVRADLAAVRAVFERRSAGNGTKGPRYSGWALLATADPDEFLLVRKLDRNKNQYTYYLCHAAPGRPATLPYFVTIAGRHWPAETSFKNGKDTFGWDQTQVRTWTAQNRRTLLTALAQIRAIALRNDITKENSSNTPVPEPGPAADPADDRVADADPRIPTGADIVPAVPGLPCPADLAPCGLSAAETARIDTLTRAYAGGHLTRARLAFHYRWSTWRRSHQARARWHHYSTRLAALVT